MMRQVASPVTSSGNARAGAIRARAQLEALRGQIAQMERLVEGQITRQPHETATTQVRVTPNTASVREQHTTQPPTATDVRTDSQALANLIRQRGRLEASQALVNPAAEEARQRHDRVRKLAEQMRAKQLEFETQSRLLGEAEKNKKSNAKAFYITATFEFVLALKQLYELNSLPFVEVK